MLKYFLTENRLTERPDDYMAHVETKGTMDRDAIIDRMLKKGTLITKTDIAAVFNSLEETIVEVMQEGNTVNMPLFNTSFSISGVFEGALDTFDTERHKLNINLSKGTLLRDAQNTIKLSKADHIVPQVHIVEVKDSISQQVNTTLTPNGVVEVYGKQLKIEGSDPTCGLYFVNTNGTETKATVLVHNTPSGITAMIPALEAGTYTVKIVTQHSGSNLLKSPRVGTFDKELTVS